MSLTAEQITTVLDAVLADLSALSDDVGDLVGINVNLAGHPLCHHPQISHVEFSDAIPDISSAISDITDDVDTLKTDVNA